MRSSAATIPERLGMVSHIMHFALHDGPGIRTTVFFKGCPLSCWWCHNPETQEYGVSVFYSEERCRHCGECVKACPRHALRWIDRQPVIDGNCARCGACAERCSAEARVAVGRRVTESDVLAEVEADLVFYEESGGGVTFSGGEPLAQPQFLERLLDACRTRRIHTVLDTCGHAPPAVALHVAQKADLIHYDLKFVDPLKHQQYTRVTNHWILENLRALLHEGLPLILRVPVIPGINDTRDDIRALRELLDTVPIARVDLLPYHATAAGKYRRLGWEYRLPDLPTPTPDHMSELAAALAQPGRLVTSGGLP